MRCLTCFLLLALAGVSAQAQIPQLLSYQGKLVDDEGTPVPDGAYTVYAVGSLDNGTFDLIVQTFDVN